MAKRADAVPINRVPWVALQKKVKGLAVLPKENNCQDSTEKSAPVGLAVDKNQVAYLGWLREVVKTQKTKLDADEARWAVRYGDRAAVARSVGVPLKMRAGID